MGRRFPDRDVMSLGVSLPMDPIWKTSWRKTAWRLGPTLFITVFVVTFVAINASFIHLDEALTDGDGHYARSVGFYQYMMTGRDEWLQRLGEPLFRASFPVPDNFPLYNPYPPLLYAVTSIFYAFFGVSHEVARHSLAPFTAIFLVAMYGIGAELGGFWVGVSVMALASASPFVTQFSRTYLLDFPQTALMTLALLFLLKSDGFRRRGPSTLFGLTTGLALLVKWSTGLALAIPVAAMLLPRIFAKRGSVLVGGVLAVAWLFLAWGFNRSFAEATSPTSWIEDGGWLRCWVRYALPPATILLLLGVVPRFLKWDSWSLAQENEAIDDNTVFNAAVAFAILLFIATPWYWLVLGDLRANLVYNAEHVTPTTLMDALTLLGRFLHVSIDLGAFLFFIGLVSIFWTNHQRYVRLVMVFNAVVLALLLFQTGNANAVLDAQAQSRILLPLIPFVAVTAAAWVAYTGPFKPIGAILLLAISAGSLLPSWLFTMNDSGRATSSVIGFVRCQDQKASLARYLGLWSAPQPRGRTHAPSRLLTLILKIEPASRRPCNTMVAYPRGEPGIDLSEEEFVEVLLRTGRRIAFIDYDPDGMEGGALEIYSRVIPLYTQPDELVVLGARGPSFQKALGLYWPQVREWGITINFPGWPSVIVSRLRPEEP